MGKYDGWDQYFESLDGVELTLTFEQLAIMIEGDLPRSAFEHQSWWSNAQRQAVWARHGWKASPNLRQRTVGFVKRGPVRQPAFEPAVQHAAAGDRRLILLGCVSEKRTQAGPAKELYVSPLWVKRRVYAESTGQPWAILSAEHGLVAPEDVLEPYDRSLKDEPAAYRTSWSQKVAVDVIGMCRSLGVTAVEVHAGSAYLESGLIAALNAAQLRALWPLRGKRIGEQLSWYGKQGIQGPSDQGDAAPLTEMSAPPVGEELVDHVDALAPEVPAPEQVEAPTVPVIVAMQAIGPFEFKWPDAIESFESGWEGEAELGGRRIRFRYGIGGRIVYGAFRVHTVTWLEGQPTVEGVAADDYPASRALLSRVKRPDGSMVRLPSETPRGYDSHRLVDHRAEIDASYSPSGLAVKIRVDDVAGWIHHAVLRMAGKTTGAKPPGQVPSVEDVSLVVEESTLDPMPDEHKHAVARALAEFAPEAAQLAGDTSGSSFAGDPEANRLLEEDPFALLVAVIADFQVPAERAWALPYLLSQRLGHLDPQRMLDDPDAVAEAVARRPSLHRYVKNVPAFIVEAARIVLDDYNGDAGRIWADEPTAVLLQQRLIRFPGISQKKAAMAVEILERDFSVPIREMHGSDIAFDVHIRRVFLRSGLAELDDQAHMIAAARRFWPERPGLLDLPSWVIGRSWCRPRDPNCSSCAIAKVCARRIDAAANVHGA